MARQQVFPYLLVVDLEDGEDVVVEETLLGCHTSHKKPLLGVITISHFWAITLDFQITSKKTKRTLLSEGGLSVD